MDIKEEVKKGYAKIAKQGGSCCSSASCCGGTTQGQNLNISKEIGYTDEDMKNVPEGANLGLGCGNPIALASLQEGETVLDLGSGAGFDCFIASKKVGPSGYVIGVDMTPEMVTKAVKNTKSGGYKNVEFRLGEIEKLPVDDRSIDVIISNCVINLSPDKPKVFKEAYRVLKNSGRLMVSDLVLEKDLPEKIKNSVEAYVGCIAGAIKKEDYLNAIKGAGFNDVKIVEESYFPVELMANDPTAQKILEDMNLSESELKGLSKLVASIKVTAYK
ncbi:MAG: arsenite S-adenosylmethyltransferase [Elusimicrobia bacterium RIFOXYA2_FULL_39_19]|nr:MAG: arsenite S-adenosylmethyltransferase [Elusimicrobia bacterium RIFOXYA2_FULL_39_19]